MKDYKSLILVIVLVAGSVINVAAQRDARTSSAKAAYGSAAHVGTMVKYKKKKPKKHSSSKVRQAKASKEKNAAYRRRSAWAG